jgi:hypothetical protein
MLASAVIEASSSPYFSPIVMAPKEDGKYTYKKYTAFVTSDGGQYAFKVTPFGLQGAGRTCTQARRPGGFCRSHEVMLHAISRRHLRVLQEMDGAALTPDIGFRAP